RREVGTGPAPGARPARGADRPPAHRAGVGVDVPATVAARGRTAPRAGRRRRCLVVGRSAAAARGLAAGWTGPEHAVVTAGPAPPRLTGGAAPGVGRLAEVAVVVDRELLGRRPGVVERRARQPGADGREPPGHRAATLPGRLDGDRPLQRDDRPVVPPAVE